jgi:2-polyprenyl-3-methyl-5-hydroxy-6-metoxy-1,4-benzoquinol methylase
MQEGGNGMLEYTGERVIPELMKPTNGMLLEHLARYYFALPYVRGRVLDLACGVGYGAHMVARMTRRQIDQIVAVDIDQATIDYARKHYYNPRLHFQQGDAVDPHLPAQLGTFDTLLSFETIEHVAEEEQFMTNLYALLNPGGTLILSTPFGKGRGKPTKEPFHVHQYTEEEFTSLFDRFANVQFYYQRGPTFEATKREGVRYPIGMAICTK